MLTRSILTAFVATAVSVAAGSDEARAKRHFDVGDGNSFGIPGDNVYDYIVVGGGTAGNAMALRLAESSKYRVAVIEAGGFYEIEDGNRSVVPGYAFGNQAPGMLSPLTDWGFNTTEQAGLLGRSIPYARGKTLGGSSALNYIAYHRPTIGSFEHWADAVGDDSYHWDNVLPYYKKSVTYTPPNNTTRFANSTPKYEPSAFNNSLNGPLQLSFPNYAAPSASWFALGQEAAGIPVNDGLCNGKLFGSQWSFATEDPTNEHRSSSQTSYLNRAIDSTTLKIYDHTLVHRVLFENKSATGVAVSTGGLNYTLNATKEVILSAGAFQSPQLLMLSGIGPKGTLSKFNIPVISVLEGVGQNMWDHISFGITYVVNVETSQRLMNTSSSYTYAAEYNYTHNQTGQLTSAAPYLGWEKLSEMYRKNLTNTTLSQLARYPADWPEIEFLVETAYSGEVEATNSDSNFATLATALITPASRGNVTINSTSPYELPIISPNYFSDPADMEVMIQGFHRNRAIWNTSVLTPFKVGLEYVPGLNVTTDTQIEHYLRRTARQLYHASCTCKMGTSSDSMAVVDERARVYGVEGLRIVDASAFPFLPPGHPQSTVYMLAEKISADILENP